MKETTAVATTRESNGNALMVFSADGANHLYRLAKTMSQSSLVPKHFQGKEADCFLAVEMAQRLQVAPFMVLQNLYIVHGKPGWSSQFLIAMANRSGTFKGVIRFEEFGSGGSLSVTAHANLADTGERVESTVSMEMAKAEGWTSNTKYQSMPVQMLRYRSATFLVRTYCPEVTMGIQTSDELETIPESEGTSRKVIDVQDKPAAAAEQLRVARAMAKDAGVPEEFLDDEMTAQEIMEMSRSYKEDANAPESATVKEQPEEAKDEKPEAPEEKPAPKVTPETTAAKVEEKLTTLEALVQKLEPDELISTVDSMLKKCSAVERSAYRKAAGLGEKDDLRGAPVGRVRRAYILLMADKQEAESKTDEPSFV